MGNATWVCFECREAVRRPTCYPAAVPCPRCGCDCACLGTKIRIPPRSDEKAWQRLRLFIREKRLLALEQVERMRVCRRHRLERKIAELETRPDNADRAEILHKLREQLTAL